MSTYSLSYEHYKALSFGLDTQIPAKVNQSTIYTEFEVFFKAVKGYLKHSRKRNFGTLIRYTVTMIVTKNDSNVGKLLKNNKKEIISS